MFLGRDPIMDREVAVKVLRSEFDNPKQRQRFLQEGRSAARLRHPNLVCIYECGEVAGQPYIGSEYIEGTPLRQVLVGTAAYDPKRSAQSTAEWIRQLAEALAYAHSEGIVHRDVKPDNIIIDSTQRPRLLDFGLALDLTDQSTLTTDGNLLGSPAYMSPEQARGDRQEVGPASDQYSLGVVLYELLAGRLPFTGPAHIIVTRILSEKPARPRSVNRGVPRDLEEICLKCLEKDPGDRYPSCHELADDLGRWLDGRSVLARPRPAWERAARSARRNPLAAGLVTTIFVMLVTFILATASLMVKLRNDEGRIRDEIAAAKIQLEREQLHIQAARELDAEAQTQLQLAEQRAEEAQQLETDTAEALADLEKTEAERVATESIITTRNEEMATAQATLSSFQNESRRAAVIATLQELPPWPRYCELIKIAAAAMKSQQYGEARSLLAFCPEALRGWEWRYLAGTTKLGVDSETNFHSGRLPGKVFLTKGVKFSADADRLASVSEDGRVRIVRLSDNAELSHVQLELPRQAEDAPRPLPNSDGRRERGTPPSSTEVLIIAPDLKQAAVVMPSQTVIWSLDVEGSGKVYHSAGYADPSRRIAGKRVAAFETDGVLIVTENGRLWDVVAGRLRHQKIQIPRDPRYMIKHIISPDGRYLAFQTEVIDVQTGQTQPTPFQTNLHQEVLYFNSNGKWLMKKKDGKLMLYNLASGSQTAVKADLPADISPDGKRLADPSGIWDVETGQQILAFDYPLTVTKVKNSYGYLFDPGIQWSSDGRRLAVGSRVLYAPENSASFPDKPDAAPKDPPPTATENQSPIP